MAWMPIAEAAVTLGVSERTIWRRIKSEAIESRNESGRTLVVLEEPELAGDQVRQLSRVAAAQLSMRKLDADTVCDVLGALSEYRASFDEQMARARRTTRWAAAIAAALLLALGAGIWYHSAQIADLQRSRAAILADVDLKHQEAVADYRAKSARAEGLFQARSDELEGLRSIGSDQRAHLAVVEASRDSLQRTMDQRLSEFQKMMTAQQTAAEARDKELTRFQATITELRSGLQDNQLAYQAVRRQSDKVTEAIRRSAARSMGLAEGLRMNLAQQQATVRGLRRALESDYLAGSASSGDPNMVDNVKLRQTIWASMTRQLPPQTDDAVKAGIPAADEPSAALWKTALRVWFQAWLQGPAAEADPAELASAQ